MRSSARVLPAVHGGKPLPMVNRCGRLLVAYAYAYAFAALALIAGSVGCANPHAGFRPPATSEARAHANQGHNDKTFARNAAAPSTAADQAGLATWYGGSFAGRRTASGERFDPTKYTAAHRKLPFGTWVEVRRADTGRSVRVRINDRGPFGDERRIIDLSRKAAEDLDLVREGVSRVEVRVIGGP